MSDEAHARGAKLVLVRFPVEADYRQWISSDFEQALAELAREGIPIVSFSGGFLARRCLF